MWARSSKLALSRLTFHYQNVNTISAYPSLSEGDLDKSWNTCGHDRRSWHYLGLPFIFKLLTLSRRTLHYPKIIWTKNKRGHDSRSWHCLGLPFTINKNGITFVKLTFCEVELVQFRAMWALSEVNLAPKLNKVGTIESGFGTKFNKLDTIGYPN